MKNANLVRQTLMPVVLFGSVTDYSLDIVIG